MGGTIRCTRCNKGISKDEKMVFIDDEVYHAKCARRLRGK